jgi:hypothetical protein
MNLIMFTDDIGEKHTIAIRDKTDAQRIIDAISLTERFDDVYMEEDK